MIKRQTSEQIINLSKKIFNNGINSHKNIYKNNDIINTCYDLIEMINTLEKYYKEINTSSNIKDIKLNFKKKLSRLRPTNKRKLSLFEIGNSILAFNSNDKKYYGGIIIKVLDYSYIIKWNDKNLRINWGIKKPIISKKDKFALSFKDFKKNKK